MAACALACGSPSTGAAAQDTPAVLTTGQIETALLVAMNRVRTARGRVPLRVAATLTHPARAQSRYLVTAGILDHDGPDGSPFWTRLVAAGFPSTHMMAENLALVSGCGPDASRRTVTMWMNSPAHRANLLNPRLRWVGAGAASSNGCGTTVLTADFGS
jgi:uncharacterized protein YkwD